MIGRTIAHYRILEKIGEGGMGVVYKAEDTHLDRFVAIKFLPPEKLADAERKRRFTLEAKAASALKHPNIITVHDIACDAGHDFIVMEYVAGKTLDQSIPGKGMRLKEVLKIASQTADALARAHAAGIVHRDVKPANIMVDERGLVKVLDFGLAKLTENVTPDDEATATIGVKTQVGDIVGTVAYMSPEQAEGRKVDSRSDIFSFGVVLYKMVTGRKPFRGDSQLSTLSAVLHQAPEPLGQDVPLDLRKLIARCLCKDPERRAQHMDDIRVQLEAIGEDLESGLAKEPVASRSRRAARWWWSAPAAAVLLSAGALLGIRSGGSREPAPAPLERLTSDVGLSTDPAVSPDGKLLAFASDRAGEQNLDIWVKQVAGGEPVRLTRDAADEHQPAFSPDGTTIAFRSEREGGGIYVIPALGGEPRLIAARGQWPRYSPDGKRIAYSGSTSVFHSAYLMNSAGGGLEQISAVFGAFRPVWSPDGKSLLLDGSDFQGSLLERSDWWIVPVQAGGAGKPIRTNARSTLARYSLSSPDPFQWTEDRILFSSRFGGTTNIWEVRISPDSYQLLGAPRRLTAGTENETHPVFTPPGRLLFATSATNINLWMQRFDAVKAEASGDLLRLTSGMSTEGMPTVSADGTKVVFASDRSGNADIWLRDLASGKDLALTSTPWREQFPVIDRAGAHVYYMAAPDGKPAIYTVPATGGIAEKVCEDCGAPTDISNDGMTILIQYQFNGPRSTLGVFDRRSGKKRETLAHARYGLYRGHFSPDERWVAFHADDPGRGTRVFVAPFGGTPSSERDWIAVTEGAVFDDAPRWSPDGRVLYYVSDADGFRCVWARRLDPVSKRPAGPEFPVKHVHGRQLSIGTVHVNDLDLGVARDKLIFTMGEMRGNLWMAKLKP